MKVQQHKDRITFENAYNDSPWWSKLWMTWAVPYMDYINKNKALEDPLQCVKMPDNTRSEVLTEKMESFGIIQKMQEGAEFGKDDKSSPRWQIIKLIWKTFTSQILRIIFWGLLADS